jgi:hypothetical protein
MENENNDLEKEVDSFLSELDKSGKSSKEKIDEIFKQYTNGRLEMALNKLKKQIENDLQKYKC